jgi:LPS-assembly protein
VIWLLRILLLNSILLPCLAVAQTRDNEGLRLSADSVSRDYTTKMITLEGRVEIAFSDQVLKADKAVIDQKNQTILAEGQVLLASKDTAIEGSRIEYNYRTKLGKIENGLVQSGQVVFEGKKLEKTGPMTFVAQDARYTSCKTCPPSWSFSGQEIDAELGGYAYIKYPILRIVDFPIFILPRILIPLKSDRQSGLLVPSLDFSKKGGAAFTFNYFWAMSRSQDMTLSLKSYERRGTKPMLEYRYVLAEGSSGILQGALLQDRAFSVDGQANSPESEVPRAYFKYKHRFELPNDVVQRAQFNYVSDLRYPRDFSEELPGHGDPALENLFSLTQNKESQHRSLEVAHYLNLLKDEDASSDAGDALSRNDDAVHRWPEIHWNFMEREFQSSNFFYSLKLNHTHFARRDFSYDDITGSGSGKSASNVRDGIFDPNQDLIRTGHRTTLEPTLSYPMQLAQIFELTPLVRYNETQYRFTANDTAIVPDPDYSRNAHRRYVYTEVGLSTVFSRVFGDDDGRSPRLKHELIPELIYSEIPWSDRPDHPFFGDFESQPYSRIYEAVNTEDFYGSSGLQFDYKDRLFERRLITLGVTNHWVRKRFLAHQDRPQYDKLATWSLRQSYDFNEAKRSSPSPWSAINSLIDIRLPRFETHTVADFYPYAKVVNWSSRVRFKSLYGNYLELNYSEKVFVDKDNNTSNKTENFGTGLGFSSKYWDFTGIANYSVITKTVEGWEYIALFKPPGDCWTIKIGHKKTTGADDVFKFSFNFEFGGV